MTFTRWTPCVLLLSAAALRLPAQEPPSHLDCNHVMMVVAGLTSTCEIRESTLDAIGSLGVTTSNGGVSVYTWDSPQVLVRSLILAAAPSESQALAVASGVQVVLSPGTVGVSGPHSSFRQSWSATLEIYVPAATELRVTTTNGGVTIQDVAGAITVGTLNGAIAIRNAPGNVTVSAVNGAVSVSAAAPWNGQTISAKTVNGSVTLALPPDCSAHVDLSTVNGHLSSTFPGVVWTISGRRDSVSFNLGAGGPAVSAATVNGSVTLQPAD